MAQTLNFKSIGQNVDMAEDGKHTYLRIDNSLDFGSSGSGKSTVIATTKGNVRLPGGVRLGVNAYKPLKTE